MSLAAGCSSRGGGRGQGAAVMAAHHHHYCFQPPQRLPDHRCFFQQKKPVIQQHPPRSLVAARTTRTSATRCNWSSRSSSSSATRVDGPTPAPPSPHKPAAHLPQADANDDDDDDYARTTRMFRLTKSGQPGAALRIYQEAGGGTGTRSSYALVAALQACGALRDLSATTQVHADAGRLAATHPYVATALVDAYAKCGALPRARAAFEATSRRTPAVWNAMISAYSGASAQAEEAWRLFERMQAEPDVAPDARTLVAALKACCWQAAATAATAASASRGTTTPTTRPVVERVRRVHALATASAHHRTDVFVGTALVDAYGRCGELEAARRVFEGMPRRDVVAWHAMIRGHAAAGAPEEAVRMYARMRRDGVPGDEQVWVGVVGACAALAAREAPDKDGGVRQASLARVREVHADVAEAAAAGGGVGLVLGTALLDAYAKCGAVEDARRVFEGLRDPDVVAWTACVAAYATAGQGEEGVRVFQRMQGQGGGVKPNHHTFVAALKACACLLVEEEQGGVAVGQQEQEQRRWSREEVLEQVRAIHAGVEDLERKRRASGGGGGGEDADDDDQDGLVVYAETTLVDVYAKCGCLGDARRVFEGMRRRDVVAWNAMVAGCVAAGEPREAVELYGRMAREGVPPDARAAVAALKACTIIATSSGVADSPTVPSSSSASPAVSDAAGDNSVVMNPSDDDGQEPQQQQSSPMEECLATVRRIHSDVLAASTAPDMYVSTELVDAYAKCGDLAAARAVFDHMPARDVAAWNAMISGYAAHSASSPVAAHQALQLYSRLLDSSLPSSPTSSVTITPDARTFVGALQACAAAGSLSFGRTIHAHLLLHSATITDPHLACALIDMYAKCGAMPAAQAAFDALPAAARDTVTWSALMAGYAAHGATARVVQLFHALPPACSPDAGVLLHVLSAYARAGRADDAVALVRGMQRDHGVAPGPHHLACLADVLARAGRVRHAAQVAASAGPAGGVEAWRCVLAACQNWRGGEEEEDTEEAVVEVARRAFEAVVGAEPRDAAAYVVMGNVYAAAGMGEAARRVQGERVRRGAWKEPGRSWWPDEARGGGGVGFVAGGLEDESVVEGCGGGEEVVVAWVREVSARVREDDA